ncbi:hypothetical protein B0H13DRAFT_2272950 [Mycena leptocephala]|nr:hypothetical protein B0H13DRAFT_2272950 [Mycena leptocephala]
MLWASKRRKSRPDVPPQIKASSQWRGMALNAEEIWNSSLSGSFKVRRIELRPQKPQQRVTIDPFRGPFTLGPKPPHDGAYTNIHKHSYHFSNGMRDAQHQRDFLAKEMQHLKVSCKKLQYLLQTGRSTPAVREKLTGLVEHIQESPAMRELDCLRDLNDFTPLYLRFCELIAEDGDTTIIIRDLRRVAKDELEKSKERLEQFRALKRLYAQGRRDLAVFFQDNVDAANKAGFPEGISSAEKSQQIHDEMDIVGMNLKKIGNILKDNQEFWEGVDSELKSASSTPSGLLANSPPDGITNGHVEHRLQSQTQKIHTGLETINGAAAQYCGSHKMLKQGRVLIQKASDLTKSSSVISGTQSSVETELRRSSCVSKRGCRMLDQLKTDLSNLVKKYAKFTQQFTKYRGWISLFFWFAASSREEKLGMDRCDPLALKNLTRERLSPYALPFESAFNVINDQLRRITEYWTELKDGPPQSSL